MMLTSIITILSLLLFLTNAGDQNRTCACSQFTTGNCIRSLTPAAQSRVNADPAYVINDYEDYCVWKYVIDTLGNHGVCRTRQWMDEHNRRNNGDLKHRRLGGHNKNKNKNKNKVKHDADDDLSEEQTGNVANDWPWGCAEIIDPLDTKDSEYQKVKERGGRTCACDGFLESDCMAMDDPMPNSGKCQWHSVTDSLGTHGICRTKTWMDCHFGGDCSNIKKQRKRKTKAANDRHRLLLDEEYELEADETINVEIDWPWECPQWTRDEVDDDNQDILVNVGSSGINTQSNGSIYGKLFGLIVFAVIIGIAVCYKFKQNDKRITLSENGGVSYSTFERV